MNTEKDKKTIEEEVNKTLHCLDRVERVKPRPFFYSRLKQRLDELERHETRSPLDSVYVKFMRPVLIPMLIVMSIVSGVLWGRTLSYDDRAENINTIAVFYGLNEPNLNDYILQSDE